MQNDYTTTEQALINYLNALSALDLPLASLYDLQHSLEDTYVPTTRPELLDAVGIVIQAIEEDTAKPIAAEIILTDLNYTQAAYIAAGLTEWFRFEEREPWIEECVGMYSVIALIPANHKAQMTTFAQGICYALAQIPTATPCNCLDAHTPIITEDDDPEELVLNAQAHLDAAVAYLDAYCENGDEYTRAYILDHLRIMAHADHGFCSRDHNLDAVLAGLNDAPDAEDE